MLHMLSPAHARGETNQARQPRLQRDCPAVLYALTSLVQHRLGRADVLYDRLAPSIDVHPASVTDAVLVAGHIDHVATRLRIGYSVVRLLVGEHDQTIVLLVDLAHGLAQVRSTVRLTGVDRITQCEPRTVRNPDQVVREA